MRAKIQRLISFLVLLCVLTASFAAPQIARAASFVVNTTADNATAGDGFCTLREAIQSANNAGNGDCGANSPASDTITFDASLSGGTITLGSTLPNIVTASTTGALTIDGSSLAAPIIISGNNAVRVMVINFGANVTLNTLVIANGNAGFSGEGGGILVHGGTLTVINSTFRGSSAYLGGGIRNEFGTITITNSTFIGNSADGGGGIFHDQGTPLTITNSTFSGNSSRFGGGIYTVASPVTITNSTISGNSADFGGGIYYQDGCPAFGSLTIINSTLSGNSASAAAQGGGIYVDCGTTNLTNTIIANSTGGDCVVAGSSPVLTSTNTLVEDGSCSASLSGDPKLAPLADNGGPTQTHALLINSPAIDAGANGSCPSTDQRGFTRPVDGDGDGAAVCDIGAYELQSANPPLVTNVSAPGVGNLLEGAQITVGITQIAVQFNQDVTNTSAVNPSNYLLLRAGGNGIQTQTCAGGVSGSDVSISIDSVTYSSGTQTSTLNVNGGTPLPNGTYRLLVCGTTSIISNVNGQELNAGWTDYDLVFLVASQTSGGGGGTGGDPDTETAGGASQLPATGFAPNKVTALPPRPLDRAYADTSLILEIPSLNVKASIVGVPRSGEGWEVQWLGREVGWLNGTAFPTWEGNSVLTAHAYDANGQPGPFANLKALQHGDRVIVHLSGQKYIFEVRQSKLVRPNVTDFALQDLEDFSYLTLITCQTYNPLDDSYLFRRIVRAVLVSVE
jgi:LPXTG-site transpeptidase (sortase) family protein